MAASATVAVGGAETSSVLITSRIATMVSSPTKASPDAAAREALLAWFWVEGSGYPWRATRDPYAVLVSEFMLQQTQATSVAEALPPFHRRFPDVRALARATPADVLRAWQGLGYNRRAVHLHRAARAIVERYAGQVPADPASLGSLPGVGPYTAAAVASIAFGVPVAAVDTNVRRVVARLALGREPLDVPAAAVEGAASSWLDPDAPGAWNQGLMDLGRFVCRPVPRCPACPLAAECRSRARGRVATGRVYGRRAAAPESFRGSMRQVRGGLVRELARRSAAVGPATLAAGLGLSRERVDAAAAALEREGLVEITPSGRLRLRTSERG